MSLYKHEPLALDDIPTTKSFGNLIEGRAHFKIIEVEVGTSKTGNPKLQIKSSCYQEDGQTGNVFDSVPLIKSWAWKVGAYFKSCGLYELYKHEEINYDNLINAEGIFIIKNETYGDKITLKPYEFVYPDKQLTLDEIRKFRLNFDDQIPF